MTPKSDLVIILLRKFVLKCLQLNISFKAQHVISCQNSHFRTNFRNKKMNKSDFVTFAISEILQGCFGRRPSAETIPNDALVHFRDKVARLLDANISANTKT